MVFYKMVTHTHRGEKKVGQIDQVTGGSRGFLGKMEHVTAGGGREELPATSSLGYLLPLYY